MSSGEQCTINVAASGQSNAHSDRLSIIRVLRRRYVDRLCPDCGHDIEGQIKFEDVSLGQLVAICTKCDAVVFDGCLNADRAQRRRLTEFDQLRPGDEIEWQRGVCDCFSGRCCMISHHGIYTGRPPNADEQDERRKCCCCNFNGFCGNVDDAGLPRIEVVSYDTVQNADGCGRKVEVRKKTVKLNVTKEEVFVIDYPESFDRDFVVKKAEEGMNIFNGTTSYSFLSNNCEHFAKWAKTGRRHSFQFYDFVRKFLILTVLFIARVVVGLTMVIADILLSHDGHPCETVENFTFAAMAGVCSLAIVVFEILYRCRRIRGSLVDTPRDCSCTRCPNRRCLVINCPILAKIIVENFISSVVPFVIILLMDAKLHCGADYIKRKSASLGAIFVIMLVFFVIARYCSRAVEQCCNIYLCRPRRNENPYERL